MIDKYKGCLVGLAVGDALGVPVEFWHQEKISKFLEKNSLEMRSFSMGETTFPAGYYSDDTSQMICLAESLIEKEFDLDDQFNRYKKWFLEGYATPLGNKSYGIGQHTLRVLMKPIRTQYSLESNDEKAGGNGSLMRSAPIGLYYHGDLRQIKEKSFESSFVTHNNRIAGWCCTVLNAAISLVIDGNSKNTILPIIKSFYGNELPESITECLTEKYEKLENYFPFSISGYSLDTLRIALWAWQTTDTFEDSLSAVIRLGGDADTFAVVTGSLTGCYYGYDAIPDRWKYSLMNETYIKSLSEKLCNKILQR